MAFIYGGGGGGGGEATTTTYSPNGGGDATISTPDADGYRSISGTGLDGLSLYDPGSAISSINDDGSRFQFTNTTLSGGNYPFEAWQYVGNDKCAILVLGQPGAFSSAVEATVSAVGSISVSYRCGAGIFQQYPASAARNNSAGVTIYGQASQVWAKGWDDGAIISTQATGPSLPARVRTELNYHGDSIRTADLALKLGDTTLTTYEGTPFSGSSWLGFAIGTLVASTVDVSSFSVTA